LERGIKKHLHNLKKQSTRCFSNYFSLSLSNCWQRFFYSSRQFWFSSKPSQTSQEKCRRDRAGTPGLVLYAAINHHILRIECLFKNLELYSQIQMLEG
jgi:hypothetical protein